MVCLARLRNSWLDGADQREKFKEQEAIFEAVHRCSGSKDGFKDRKAWRVIVLL